MKGENPTKRKAVAGTNRGVHKYHPHMAIAAAYMYAQGASDYEVAEGLGVGRATIHRWARVHPEFGKARSESSLFVEARLANALINSAEGARKVEVVEIWDGENSTWRPERRKVTELPPNPQAILAWLHARNPDKWRDKQEIEVSVDTKTAELLDAGRARMQRVIEELQANVRDSD